MTEVLNIWRSNEKKRVYYTYLGDPVYVNGDYAIYKEFSESYIYAYKDKAFNCLAGLNKEHLDRVAKRERPESNYFLYDRAMENLELLKTFN